MNKNYRPLKPFAKSPIMNTLDWNCPAPASISDIPATSCELLIGQVVRIAFQRIAGGAFTDITDEKLMIKELSRSLKELNQRNES
jgi:hypothetical protein